MALPGVLLPGYPPVGPDQTPASGSPPSAFDLTTPLPATVFLHPLSLALGARLFPAPVPVPAPGLNTVSIFGTSAVTATLVKDSFLVVSVSGSAAVGATLVKSAFLGPVVNGLTTVTGSVVGLKVLSATVNGVTTVGATVLDIYGPVSNTSGVDANRAQHLILEVR